MTINNDYAYAAWLERRATGLKRFAIACLITGLTLGGIGGWTIGYVDGQRMHHVREVATQ